MSWPTPHLGLAALLLSLAAAPQARAEVPATGGSEAPHAPAVRATAGAPPAQAQANANNKPPKLTAAKSAGARGSLEELLGKDLYNVWRGRTLRRGTTAVYVVDARSGDVLYAVHEDDPLNPASNVKLVATATALDLLGPNWRYHTRIYGPTPAPDHVVTGDLYLLGNYDPTLTANHLTDLAGQIASRGIVEIRGDLVVGTDGRRDSLGRPKVKIEITGTRPGQPPAVKVTPATDLVTVEVTAKTTSRRRARLSVTTEAQKVGEVERCVFTIDGTARRGRSRTYRRWVPQRSLFTAHLLRTALADAGVLVTGAIRAAEFDDYVRTAVAGSAPYLPIELAHHQSVPLGRLVTKINKRSINWLADAVLLTAGAVAYGGPPTMAKGVRAMDAWLERQAHVDPDEVKLDTGSGLSYKSKISARQIIAVLRAAAGYTADSPVDDRAIEAFRQSLAVAGRDGTLRRRFAKSKVRGHMRGKTGTLTRIIALSGIIGTDDDNALLFAIVTNNHGAGLRSRVRREHELMVKAMYRYLERRKSAAANR